MGYHCIELIKRKTDLKNLNLQITINSGHALPKAVGLKHIDVRICSQERT